jgi:ABC-2 type transport system ATP-binding protein
MGVPAARGIRKSFGRRQVLAGLDLEIAPGEMVAVVGENGTGKTTLRILAGDLRPEAATVAIRGRPGYCPQTALLDEALTVDQHVRYFQAAYGIGSRARAGGTDRAAGL